MPNTFYPKGAEKICRAQINFDTDTIKAAIVSDGYTYSAAHEFFSDVGVLVGSVQTLSAKTTVGGVFDAADVDFGAIASGKTAKAVVLYKDTGNPSTSPLLCYISELTGFPFTTNGGGVSIPWSDETGKIFSLMPA